MRRRTWLLIALGGLLADQAVQLTALRDGWLAERRIAPFDPPLFTAEQVRSLARVDAQDPARRNVRFDAELGWVTTEETATHEGGRLIVAVGCSFTHGDEVERDQTWCAQLQVRRPDLDIRNLGVGGYGADQILLRLRRDGLPLRPEEVWLGLLPAAALRVTDMYRPALRHHDVSVAFKPRFLLRNGELVLVPCPAREPRDIVELLGDQQNFLGAVGEHDLWVRRWPSAYAPFGSSWTHRFAASRLLLTKLEAGGRDPAEWLADEQSEVFRVLRAILQTAARESEAAGARFRLLVLPDSNDLRRHGYWDALLAGLPVVDLSPALQGEGLWQPGGHYSPRANALIAAALETLPAGS